jgi:hypothetical protein
MQTDWELICDKKVFDSLKTSRAAKRTNKFFLAPPARAQSSGARQEPGDKIFISHLR